MITDADENNPAPVAVLLALNAALAAAPAHTGKTARADAFAAAHGLTVFYADEIDPK